MPVHPEKKSMSGVAGLAAATIVLATAGLCLPVGYEDGSVAVSAAWAVGNGNGNGGTGNGKGRGDERGGGQAASNDHGGGSSASNGGQGQGSSHANGAAGRGSLNSAKADAQAFAHANRHSRIGALRDYMASMADYAANVEDQIAAELAKQEYLDSLAPAEEPDPDVLADLDKAIADAEQARQDYLDGLAEGEDPDQGTLGDLNQDVADAEQTKQDYLDSLAPAEEPDPEILADLDQDIADAEQAVDESLKSAAESFLDAANKDGQITDAVVNDVNGALDGKAQGFLDPDGHIAGSADDLFEAIDNL